MDEAKRQRECQASWHLALLAALNVRGDKYDAVNYLWDLLIASGIDEYLSARACLLLPKVMEANDGTKAYERKQRSSLINTCLAKLGKLRMDGKADGIVNFDGVEALAKDVKVKVQGGCNALPELNDMLKTLQALVPMPEPHPDDYVDPKTVKQWYDPSVKKGDHIWMMDGRLHVFHGRLGDLHEEAKARDNKSKGAGGAKATDKVTKEASQSNDAGSVEK